MKTSVVNLRTSPYDVYIGRAGHGHDGYFGNPFRLDPLLSRKAQEWIILETYRKWFLNRIETDPEFRRRVLELKGKRLGCFCKPQICHGDVIADWLNSQW